MSSRTASGDSARTDELSRAEHQASPVNGVLPAVHATPHPVHLEPRVREHPAQLGTGVDAHGVAHLAPPTVRPGQRPGGAAPAGGRVIAALLDHGSSVLEDAL